MESLHQHREEYLRSIRRKNCSISLITNYYAGNILDNAISCLCQLQ